MIEQKEYRRYAKDKDIIAVLESELHEVSLKIEGIEKIARIIENDLRMSVENEWTEKKSEHLSNEKKRQIAYDTLAAKSLQLNTLREDKDEFVNVNIYTKIEIDNEKRAYNLMLARINAGLA